MNEKEYEEHIRKIAHGIWIEEGCPDGELLLGSHKYLKIKDYHWMKAKTRYEVQKSFDDEIFNLLDIINGIKL